MRKTLKLILWLIIMLLLASFSYAMVFNSYLVDNGTSQIINIPSNKSMVFSLSKQIDSITFSKDNGFTIRTLEWWEWVDMTDNVSDYTPMKWYLVRNISDWNLEIKMNLKNITSINDTIFQKTLKAGWNLVWPAYKDDNAGLVKNIDAFGNSNYSHIADFTGQGFIIYWESKISKNTISWEVIIEESDSNFINSTVKESEFQIKNKNELANVVFVEWLAYAVFVSNDTVIPGSQKITSEENSKENIDDLFDDLFWEESNTGSLDFIYNTAIKWLFDDKILLAWSNNQTIYNFELNTWSQNITIKSLKFKIKGWNFVDNFKHIKLYNAEQLIANYSWTSFDWTDTFLEFEEIEIVKDTNYSNLQLVADLEKYSINWDDISVNLWKAEIWFDSMNWNFRGEVKNDEWNIISDYNELFENMYITPSLLNISTIKELWENDDIAKIKLQIESGNNILWDQKIKIKRISWEAKITSIRNDDNEEKFISRELHISNLIEFEVDNWDEIEIQVDWFDWNDHWIKIEYEIAGKYFWTNGTSIWDYTKVTTPVWFDINQVKVNDIELVLWNWVETVLYKAKLNSENWNTNILDLLFTPSIDNNLSNNLEISDIIESSTLNIWWETFNWNITWNWISFTNLNKNILDWVEVEMLLTATLKANDNMINWNILSIKLDSFENIAVSTLNKYITKTILNKNGLVDLSIEQWISNSTENILAWTSNVELSKMSIDIEKEDWIFDELIFRAWTEDFSDSLFNVKLMNWNNIVSQNSTVTFDKYTLIKFKDFQISTQDDMTNLILVADIRNYTDIWENTSSKLWEFNISFDSMIVKWESSNNDLTQNIISNNSNKNIKITPAVSLISVVEKFWTNKNTAKIRLTVDKWNNEITTSLTKLSVSNIDTIFDEDNNEFANWKEFSDWDIYTLETSYTGSPLFIDKSKIWFTINWVEYDFENNENLDLGAYTE